MTSTNETTVTEFILLGFTNVKYMKLLLFAIFLFIYIVTISGNIVIVAIIFGDAHLHTPMYFFLCNLSCLEIVYTSTIIPKMLVNIMMEEPTVSFTGCIVQLYFFGSLGSTECYLLVIMAYDRYVAICKPLHYSSLMTTSRIILMALCSWSTAFFAAFGEIVFISQLHFCGPNKIKHYFCDLQPVVKLSCQKSYAEETVYSILASTILIVSFLLILVSYVRIILTMIQMSSSKGRQTAFSTCTAHITVVVIFYGAAFSIHVIPNAKNNEESNKVSSLLYTIVTPLMNPFIYTLRNKDVKQALHKAFIGTGKYN